MAAGFDDSGTGFDAAAGFDVGTIPIPLTSAVLRPAPVPTRQTRVTMPARQTRATVPERRTSATFPPEDV